MNSVRLLLLLLAITPQLYALSIDRDKPIHVEADLLEVDDSRHISHYQGNVIMTQGSLVVHADQIDYYFNADNDLLWMEMKGRPATFDQLDDRGKPVSGSALWMKHDETNSLFEMRGQAVYKSDQDIIESENIQVNTETDALQAGMPDGNDRVRMLIQPKNDQ